MCDWGDSIGMKTVLRYFIAAADNQSIPDL